MLTAVSPILFPTLLTVAPAERNVFTGDFTVLPSFAKVQSASNSRRHQEFEKRLERFLDTITEYELLGFRGTQIEACKQLSNLDKRERWLIKVAFVREEHDPLKRLLLASVLNAELRRDNLKEPLSGNRAAKELCAEGLPCYPYEKAFLFRGLDANVDQYLSELTGFELGTEHNYFTPKDPLFLSALDKEQFPFPLLVRSGLIKWVEDLEQRVEKTELSFEQAYAIIQDTYLFQLAEATDIRDCICDPEVKFSTRVLLSGAANLIDPKLWKDNHSLLQCWLSGKNEARRTLATLICWGSESPSMNQMIIDTLLPTEKQLNKNPSYTPPHFFDILLLASTLNPRMIDPTARSILGIVTKTFKAAHLSHAENSYDEETQQKLYWVPAVKELKLRHVDVDIDLSGVNAATGNKHSLAGPIWKQLITQTADYLVERASERSKTTARMAKMGIKEIFALTHGREVCKLVSNGLTPAMLAEELYVLTQNPNAHLPKMANLAASALSISKGRERLHQFHK